MAVSSLRSLLTVVGLFIVGAVLPPMPSQAAQEHNVPYGTPVDVRLEHAVSSRDLHDGSQIAIRVVRDVVADGCIVIRRGARGLAEVMYSEPARIGANRGQLTLQLLWVRAVDHSRIGVAGTRFVYGRERDVAVLGRAINQTGTAAYYYNGSYDAGSPIATSGAILEGIALAQKGGEATLNERDAIHGKIANVWGVSIESDLLATGEDDSIVK